MKKTTMANSTISPNLEIERKYVVIINDPQKLHRISEIANIEQTYLLSPKGVERRVRKYTCDNVKKFFYTEKKGSGLVRVEHEKEISEKEYLEFLSQADPYLYKLTKMRYQFIYNHQFFELDVYDFSDYKAILEIELESETQKVHFPAFLTLVKEVTDDTKYKNHQLAKNLSFPD